MENEILFNLQNITLEIAVMSFVVFALTMVIKIPIKRATSKLEEAKRKSYNTLIILIPLVLALLACFVYYGLVFGGNCFEYVLKNFITVYILATFIYAVYQRVVIVIKGMKTSLKIDPALAKDVVKYLKSSIREINHTLKDEKKGLSKISKRLNELYKIRATVEMNVALQEATPLGELDTKIATLKAQQTAKHEALSRAEINLKKYKEKLFSKKSTKNK